MSHHLFRSAKSSGCWSLDAMTFYMFSVAFSPNTHLLSAVLRKYVRLCLTTANLCVRDCRQILRVAPP
uniref:Uncharacterized protein n=1 Tax=Mola mola TaxID=94237 RepID=A0A3Q4B320_MOLML